MTASDEHEDTGQTRANPGYALQQLARALTTASTNPDAETQRRAKSRVQAWLAVLRGTLSGDLQVGARTPVAGTPSWATLRVLKGGFSTGELLAGGPRTRHERALLARLGKPFGEGSRAALAEYYLSERGLAELTTMLHDGHYRIDIPEEGAFLVVAWLVEQGKADAARTLIETLGSHLGTLRFWPVPRPWPAPSGDTVRLRTVGQTRAALDDVRDRPHFGVHREALRVWIPVTDRLVGLFAATVVGPAPTVAIAGDAGQDRKVVGGWPCQVFPAAWRERAQALLTEIDALRAQHQLCRRRWRKGSTLTLLRDALGRCLVDPASLTGRDVGRVRMVLAHVASRPGLPGSARAQAVRGQQATEAALPGLREAARTVAARLAGLAPDEGLLDPLPLTAPLAPGEAGLSTDAKPRALPVRIRRLLLRTREGSVETLLSAGVLSSGELLAQVAPQVAASVIAAGIEEANLRRLYVALYRAFRQRRSLLLFDLAHQVRFSELPWVAALTPWLKADTGAPAAARTALTRLTCLALDAFPHAILPNRLLTEFRALAKAAELDLPLVDELAADIFMGEFTAKYLQAAQRAGALLEGTLYEKYYAIPYAALRAMDDVRTTGAPVSPGFGALCSERAGGPGGRSVAANGTVIEQQQILTTQNLAVLVDALGLRTVLPWPELARRAFTWACDRLLGVMGRDAVPTTARVVKDAAYAWRQMIFYLALSPASAVEAHTAWMSAHVAKQPASFRKRFAPALVALGRAASGADAEVPPEARRFLGWTRESHWLLEARPG